MENQIHNIDKQNIDDKKKNRAKKMYISSVIALILALIALIGVTLAWFFNRRELDTLTWIKTPIRLEIGSGNNHDIAYLDLGSIDADTSSREIERVFCVYGEPVDIYSLQLSYTTNIAFYYDIYRANYAPDNGNVVFTYTDADGDHTERFGYASDTPVIATKPLNKMNATEIAAHQSHTLSYGDEKGLNPVNSGKVQSNAEPLYWLASEDRLNVLNPKNVKENETTGSAFFCDYYVLKIHWDEGTVINDKETDMVYLTVSR
ncbi:MAG: hypothetical protein EGR88_11125 [Ruminococcus sp. SR1/5]|nr:hypothetical protein [Ruminococcus sp.]